MDERAPLNRGQKQNVLGKIWRGLGKAQIATLVALAALAAAVISAATDVIDVGWLGQSKPKPSSPTSISSAPPPSPAKSSPSPSTILSPNEPVTPTTTPAAGAGRPVSAAPSTMRPSALVVIAYPRSDEVVSRCFMATGRATGFASDRLLWATVRIPDANNVKERVFLDNQVEIANATWSEALVVGSDGDAGRPYWIEIYQLDAKFRDQAQAVGGTGEALSDVPEYFIKPPIAEVRVVRSQQSGQCG
jgi:hypothetical protein